MAEFSRVSTTSERLIEAMDDLDKKQIDLSKSTGLNRSTISRYMSGAVEPKQSAIHRLAVALNVSEMWLWGYDVPRERTPSQKKNDQLAELVAKLRENEMFYSLVSKLSTVDDENLDLIDKLVDGLTAK
jgi:transcriptional regulator with XRE-family HTH domain